MPPIVFSLPLEGEDGFYEEYMPFQPTPTTKLVIDVDPASDSETPTKIKTKKDKKYSEPPPKQPKKPPPRFSRVRFTWRMLRWHIFLFMAMFGAIYSIFVLSFSTSQKWAILSALTFIDDWKQMAFFLGVYNSYAIKKVSDVTSHVPPTDKIANLVSIAVKKHRVQKAIMKYVCTSLAMVFSYISPMVQHRLYSSEKNIKAKLEVQSQKTIAKIEKKLLNMHSSHFMPIKWALHVIYEAVERDEVDPRLLNTLINELNSLHVHCDRLINFKHETFSWGLTIGAKISVYGYFLVGALRNLWTSLHGQPEPVPYSIIGATFSVNFVVFLLFLTILRLGEQIVQPYNEEHDVFELNRILDEKLEVAAFVLNKECDLRTKILDRGLLP